jgi:hypothetical protein
MCLTYVGYADIWQRLLLPMSKVVLQKASVKDKIITFESSHTSFWLWLYQNVASEI